jgi:hypothetical protein
VLSQTWTHSSVSAFGTVVNRRLAGLELRRLWILDTDMRLLGKAITILFHHDVSLFHLDNWRMRNRKSVSTKEEGKVETVERRAVRMDHKRVTFMAHGHMVSQWLTVSRFLFRFLLVALRVFRIDTAR